MTSKVWKFLESAGVVTLGEDEPATEEVAPTPPPTTTGSVPTVAAPAPVIDTARFAEVDRSCRAKLEQAMANDGAPLPEQFMETLSVLESIPVEEARYKTALQLLGKQGHSAGAVLSDYDKTLGVLETTARAFESSLQNQIAAKVGSKQAAVERLATDIETKRAQIQAMQTEIEQLTRQRDSEQNGITEEQLKITTVQQRFQVIYGHVKVEITAQRAKIAQYGGL